MSPKSLSSRHSIDSCLFHLNSWKPFSNPKTLDLDSNPNPNPNPKTAGIYSKRPCFSDRSTSLFSLSIDTIDFSKLSLFDEPRNNHNHHRHNPHHNPHHHQSRTEKLRWSSVAKKRRRKGGSKSVSGRSSDRNGGCRSVAAATATATCSDFMVAKSGTDSSGELFGNNVNGWASDVGECRRESINGNSNNGGNVGVGEMGVGFGFDGLGSESGYGSEPGYRGDAEFGYGDEVDDEEDEGARLLMLWGKSLGDCNTEMVGENTFSEQKTHHRGRRKKHDLRMVDSVR